MTAETFLLFGVSLIAVIGVGNCGGSVSYTNGCGDCMGPWIFPFTAEKVIHAVIADDAVAEMFKRTVLENKSLTASRRSAATQIFLYDERYALGSMLEELYRNATIVVNFEKSSYLSTMCYTEPCPYYLHMVEILMDMDYTDDEICKELQFLFCDVSDTELEGLRNMPVYPYRVERGAHPPSFFSMNDTYILSKQNFSVHTLSRINAANYFMSVDDAYFDWVGTLRGEVAQALAMLHWNLYMLNLKRQNDANLLQMRMKNVDINVVEEYKALIRSTYELDVSKYQTSFEEVTEFLEAQNVKNNLNLRMDFKMK